MCSTTRKPIAVLVRCIAVLEGAVQVWTSVTSRRQGGVRGGLERRAQPVAAVLGHDEGVVLPGVVGTVRHEEEGVAAEGAVGAEARGGHADVVRAGEALLGRGEPGVVEDRGLEVELSGRDVGVHLVAHREVGSRCSSGQRPRQVTSS